MNPTLPVPSVTLQTAVILAVKNFGTNGQTFSIHDITKAIRNQCNNGELEIPEVEITGGGQYRFEVEHTKVKALFLDLFNSGAFDNDFALLEEFNRANGFRTYTPQTQVNTPTSPVPVVGTAPITTPVVTISAPTASTTKSIDSEVQGRIQKYLDNCKNRNFRPSLRHVQSAIKRGDHSTGYSVEDLRDFIQGLGYQFSMNPDSLAKYQVVV
jgi:hypothetical protein